jgi:hypothetical protein
MKPPRRRMTTRALIVLAALFALDLAGIVWTLRQSRHFWGPTDPIADLIVPAGLFLGTYLFLFALIHLFIPPRLDEGLMAFLTLIALATLIAATLGHW